MPEVDPLCYSPLIQHFLPYLDAYLREFLDISYGKYFNFPLSILVIQEPLRVFLGKRWKYVMSKGRKKLKRISDYGYHVPLLKSLEVHIMPQCGLQWTNHFCYVIVIEKNESATGINALVMDYKLQFGFIYRNIVSRVDCQSLRHLNLTLFLLSVISFPYFGVSIALSGLL